MYVVLIGFSMLRTGDRPAGLFVPEKQRWNPSPRGMSHVFAPQVFPGMKLTLFLSFFFGSAVAFSPLALRRSVVKYDKAKAVPPEVVDKALEAAVLAPNHFLSEPWRFYTAGPETKAKLCGLNEDKRAMFEGVPEWLIVTLCSEHEEGSKLYLEDHAAVACATQNFMLSLADDGLGSKWMTGALGAAPEDVLAAVGADASTEKLMGAIWY